MSQFIFITGAESTGKSTLTKELATHYGAVGVEEFARNYLENLSRPYNYGDLLTIAEGQLNTLIANRDRPLVFFDTDLINLKVWFTEVFQTVPDWLLDSVMIYGVGAYLVCQPDIPWVADPLRENPDRREYLTECYETELTLAGFHYFRVFGSGSSRLESAIRIVDQIIDKDH